MLNTTGNKRVIVTNVLPSVDEGRFRAKAIQNQAITLSADIFTDGNDTLEASLAIKHKSEKQWTTLELKSDGNDKWAVSFDPVRLGIYQFQVQGWINHFLTWQKALQKKYKAKQQVEVEIEIGILLAEATEARATGKYKPLIRKWINEVRSQADIDLKVQLAFNNNITQLMSKCRDKTLVTLSPTIYEIQVDPQIALYGTWYEMFPRSAATEAGRHGTFKDVKALLPYINKMGFDVLYFPPIHPIGEKHRKGKNNALTTTSEDPGSPWAIGNTLGGHKAIHPELGTLKDFKELISAAGKLDMKIAMDIAFQCAPDHPYVRLHPEWFMWRPDGTVQYAENPPKKYEDILPFNFETDAWERLWQELKSIFIYWIEAGIEIFRVDNPHTKTFPFWEWVIGEVKEEHPQVMFLAEAFTRPRIMERLGKLGFSQSYTYFAWRNTKKELEEYITSLIKTDLKHYFRPNLWANTPDILTDELVTGGENAHIIRLILAATLSASYGLYGPVYELGINESMPGKEEYNDNEKYEIKHWDWNKYTKIKEVLYKINKIRKDNPALQTTDNTQFLETSNEHIICYIKADLKKQNVLIIAVNLDPHNTQGAQVNLPADINDSNDGKPLQVKDLLTGDKFEWRTGWNHVSLNPYDLPCHVLSVQQ